MTFSHPSTPGRFPFVHETPGTTHLHHSPHLTISIAERCSTATAWHYDLQGQLVHVEAVPVTPELRADVAAVRELQAARGAQATIRGALEAALLATVPSQPRRADVPRPAMSAARPAAPSTGTPARALPPAPQYPQALECGAVTWLNLSSWETLAVCHRTDTYIAYYSDMRGQLVHMTESLPVTDAVRQQLRAAAALAIPAGAAPAADAQPPRALLQVASKASATAGLG